ncbi:hypothetical protein CSB45_05900 [candidate division KSB3 bacterium]|uniref:DUF4124 domain-containing protein n=1 Tax=candidate division KSB3 bacterium TaxID=2044937 RepID=A0A2G6E753_9BACT|nr:MAG: hypothetical protein CSB45_05900 [candidate division KSB3 bacterium]PIE30183.1 MAG: hypothetical protein CSA57_04620 [candidate division KSB3 bacterium]
MKDSCIRRFLFGGLFGILAAAPVFAEMYRWQDNMGKTHYSTSPPSHRIQGPIEVKRSNRWYRYTGENDSQPAARQNQSAPITYSTSFPRHYSEKPEEASAESRTIVPYSQQNSVMIVDVTINNRITRPFAVDTGASYTVISPEIANALFLTPAYNAPQVTLQTANGRIKAALVNLERVRLGSLETPNITAAIHDMQDASHISGLLGLNVLKRFQMTVDSMHHQLIFKTPEQEENYAKQNCVKAREQLRLGRELDDLSNKERSCYQKAISLCPDLLEAYYCLGAVYIKQKDARNAVELHQKIVAMQPDEAEAYFRLGVAYILQKKFGQAQRQLQQALRLDPNHQQAAEYLKRLKNQ